jgi:hypothetical protein
VMKRLEDPAVYPIRPSQVIRVDDQILHSLSRSRGLTCPIGQLLFRAPTRIRTIDPFDPQL